VRLIRLKQNWAEILDDDKASLAVRITLIAAFGV